MGSISLEKKESGIKLTLPIPFFGDLEIEHELRVPQAAFHVSDDTAENVEIISECDAKVEMDDEVVVQLPNAFTSEQNAVIGYIFYETEMSYMTFNQEEEVELPAIPNAIYMEFNYQKE